MKKTLSYSLALCCLLFIFASCSQSKSLSQTEKTTTRTHKYNKTYVGNKIVYKGENEEEIPVKEVNPVSEKLAETTVAEPIVKQEPSKTENSTSTKTVEVERPSRKYKSKPIFDFLDQQFSKSAEADVSPEMENSTSHTANSGDVYAILGFVFGLLGLVLFWFPLINILFSIPGFIFSLLGLDAESSRGLAIAAVVLSSIALLLSLIVLLGVLAG